MEFLVASAIGILTAAGLYLVFRLRTFPVIMGVSLLTYAVNVFLFCLLYTSPSPRDQRGSRMPSSA